MFVCLASILIFVKTTVSISVSSTATPYAAGVTSTPTNSAADYISPTTIEPTIDEYKFNNPANQYPFSRQFLEPLFTPSNHYAESLSPSNSITPKAAPLLFHRLPFFPTTVPPPPYSNLPQQPTYPSGGEQHGLPYNLHSYAAQPPYSFPNFPNQPSPVEPHYPFTFPTQKFLPKSPFSPDCEYHASPSVYRNIKPVLFYPHKPENYFEPSLPLAKPSNTFYRYQPSPYGTAFTNNIYH